MTKQKENNVFFIFMAKFKTKTKTKTIRCVFVALVVTLSVVVFLAVLTMCVRPRSHLSLGDPASVPSPLNGEGRAVDWWYILKLPAQTFSSKEWRTKCGSGCTQATYTNVGIQSPCQGECGNSGTQKGAGPADGYGCANRAYGDDDPSHWNDSMRSGGDRGGGMCYLYADSSSPALRYYSDANLPCLQSEHSPLSRTAAQFTRSDFSHLFWNDQTQSGADSIYCRETGDDPPTQPNPDPRCARSWDGCATPFAHSKGGVAWKEGGRGGGRGGMVLVVSTPDFPDASGGPSAFAPLGCQMDNNVEIAQQFFAFSTDSTSLLTLGKAMFAAGLCGEGTRQWGGYPPNVGEGGGFLEAQVLAATYFTDPTSPLAQAWSRASQQKCAYDPTTSPPEARQCIKKYDPQGGGIGSSESGVVDLKTRGGLDMTVIVKGAQDPVTPWSLVAATLKSNLTVSSWWSLPTCPTLCAQDKGRSPPPPVPVDPPPGEEPPLDPGQPWCLAPGSENYNVENVLTVDLSKLTGRDTGWWNLGFSGSPVAGNHAKWGITTPAAGDDGKSSSSSRVIVGDMNSQGAPSGGSFDSTSIGACEISQPGRGGLFYAFHSPELWSSLHSLIGRVCACDGGSAVDGRYCSLSLMRDGKGSPYVRDPVVTYGTEAASTWTGDQAWSLPAGAGTADLPCFQGTTCPEG